VIKTLAIGATLECSIEKCNGGEEICYLADGLSNAKYNAKIGDIKNEKVQQDFADDTTFFCESPFCF